MKITMTNEVEKRDGETNGRKWLMRSQVGYIKLSEKEKYPRRVMIQLADNAQPYLEGEYEFGPETFQIGKFDKLELARVPVLYPVVAVAKPQARAAS
jgi:hypothetical protein